MNTFVFSLALIAVAQAALPEAWQEGYVTYYGGVPSGGGSCEWPGEVTGSFPFGMNAATDFTMYEEGQQCGACFEVKCSGAFTQGGANDCQCNPNPIVIQVDNSCCNREYGLPHFDLNPAAMDAILDNDIGTCGMASIQFRRVPCDYGKNAVIQTKSGVSAYWYGFILRDLAGYGNAIKAEIKSSGSDTWHDCPRSAAFRKCVDSAYPLVAPASIRLTDVDGNQIVATDLITDLSAGEKDWDFGSNFASAGGLAVSSASAPTPPSNPAPTPVPPANFSPANNPHSASRGSCKKNDACTHDNNCCAQGVCYEANQWYAQCRNDCSIRGWTCKALSGGGGGGAGGAAPVPQSTPTLTAWANCVNDHTGCPNGYNCYEEHSTYAQCMPKGGCGRGKQRDGWTCVKLG